MSPDTFQTVLEILSADPSNPHLPNPRFVRGAGAGRPPTPLIVQLANFLRSTTGATHISSARETATSEGSSYNFSDRIVDTLLELSDRFVRMPATEQEKAEISEEFGWPGAIGAVDGVLFKLKDTPLTTPIFYYCRKKFYGVNSASTQITTLALMQHLTDESASVSRPQWSFYIVRSGVASHADGRESLEGIEDLGNTPSFLR